MKSRKKTKEKNSFNLSEKRSVLRKSLTGPTLLEISGVLGKVAATGPETCTEPDPRRSIDELIRPGA